MPTFTSVVTIAGANSIFVARRNIYGIMTGWGGVDASAPGSASGVRRASGIETIPNPVVPPNRVRRTYDDGPGRIYQFAGVQIPQGDFGFGKVDLDLEALAQGSQTWIRGNWKKGVRGVQQPVFSDLMILTHSVSASEDAATSGAPGYWNTLFGDVQALPLGSQQHQAQQTADSRYSAIFNPMVSYIDGRPFGSSNFNTLNGTTIVWWSTYPALFHTKIGDGAWNSVVLDYTPVDAQSTKVSQAVVSGGVVTVTDLAVLSVTPSTKTIVLTSTPPSGAYVIVEYEALNLIVS